MYNFGAASQYQHEGYNFGAATSTPASAAALGTAFSQFASTVTRFADSLPSSQAAWASSLRNAVSSLARGMNNVLAGTLPAAPWLRSVNDILLQIRQEQSGGMSLAQSLVDAIATSASAVGRAAQTLV